MKLAYIFLLFIISDSAFSACTRAGSQTTQVSFGNILVQRDTAIGSTIAEGTATVPSGVRLLDCSGSGTSHYLMQYGTPVSGYAHIYHTNLDGVGISVRDSGNIWFENPSSSLSWGNSSVYSGRSYHVSLIKIGDITPGALSLNTIGVGYVESNPSNIYLTLNMAGGRVDVAACNVSTPVVNVELGNYLSTDFTGVNDTTVAKSVPITLDCSSGSRINALVTADSDTSTSQQGAIKLSAGGDTASGVAVQLLDKNNVPVKLNQKFLVSTTTSEGQFNFNWTARYLQTQSTVTLGDANATATLALTYE